MAFLDNGVVSVQESLVDVKAKYRREEYMLETEKEVDVVLFQQSFPNVRQISRNQLSFCESDYAMFDMLRFIAEKHIPILKLERAEPTLESLFMEVVEK